MKVFEKVQLTGQIANKTQNPVEALEILKPNFACGEVIMEVDTETGKYKMYSSADEIHQTQVLTLRRVSYGRRDTPVAKREYRCEGSQTVGTLEEWKEVYPKHELIVVELEDQLATRIGAEEWNMQWHQME